MRTLIILVCLLGAYRADLFAQFSVTSTQGYTVTIDLTPTNVLTDQRGSSCSYEVIYDYDIRIEGPNAPAALWTLQAYLQHDRQQVYIPLPNSGGRGSTKSTRTSQSQTKCGRLDVSGPLALEIQGPGIVQTILSEQRIPTDSRPMDSDQPTVASFFLTNLSKARSNRLLPPNDTAEDPYTHLPDKQRNNTASSLCLFPNPATHYLQWTSPEDINHWVIFDATGRKMAAGTGQEQKISLEELTTGTYFLQVHYTDRQPDTHRFVKR